MVAYAAERSVLDPNFELHAVAATTDPGGSSCCLPDALACPTIRTAIDAFPFEPTAPPPELDESRLAASPSCPHRPTNISLTPIYSD